MPKLENEKAVSSLAQTADGATKILRRVLPFWFLLHIAENTLTIAIPLSYTCFLNMGRIRTCVYRKGYAWYTKQHRCRHPKGCF